MSKILDAWRVRNIYKDGDSFGNARLETMTADALTELQALFSGDHIKEGDTVIRLLVNDVMWMSDSMDEYRDHWMAIRQARGRVLIHGLGLGCYLNTILTKDEVTHVDVVEKDSDVLGLICPYFQGHYQDGRVTFHHDDAFEKKWPKGTRWNYVWHDIWATKCEDDLKEHAKLNRKFGHRTEAQGCWAHETLVAHRRADARSAWWRR